MLLKRSKTLARHESTREVYIGPDLTRKERLANKDLREELKARRARGEENIFIRRNEIVTAPPLRVAPPMLAVLWYTVPNRNYPTYEVFNNRQSYGDTLHTCAAPEAPRVT